MAKDLQPLRNTQFCVEIENNHKDKRNENRGETTDILKSSNGKQFHFNTQSNRLVKLEKPFGASGNLKEIEFTQEYLYYTGYQTGSRTSGAYIFRPNEEAPTPLGDPTTSISFSGDLFHEIHQTFYDPMKNIHVSQVLRIPQENTSFLFDVEVEWMVGPIPIKDNQGKEFVHRIHVNGLENNGLYYTDSNGRQYMERRRNVRPDFEVPNAELLEPVTSNYYPITSNMYIEDDEKQLRLTLLTDRSQGGGSIRYI